MHEINITSTIAITPSQLGPYLRRENGYTCFVFKKGSTVRTRKTSECTRENMRLAFEAGWEITVFEVSFNYMSQCPVIEGIIRVMPTVAESDAVDARLELSTPEQDHQFVLDWKVRELLAV